MSVRIEGRIMDHAHGQWAGSRPQWWTATDEATGFSVTWHEHTEGLISQHSAKAHALTCLSLMIEEMRPLPLPEPVDAHVCGFSRAMDGTCFICAALAGEAGE